MKVVAWCDNEVGYANRLMDLVEKFVWKRFWYEWPKRQ